MSNFIPFDIAKLIKDKSFNLRCLAYYDNDGGLYYFENLNFISNPQLKEWQIPAPTYTDVVLWFRQTHKIKIDVCHASSNGSETFTLWKWNYDNVIGKWQRIGHIGSYYDYFETLNKAILEAIKLLE